MLETLLLATSLLFCGVHSLQGEDMDDEDFEIYVEAHENIRAKYGESAAKGCIGGAIGGAPTGLQALCIGCAAGAAANVAQDMIFGSEAQQKADNALRR